MKTIALISGGKDSILSVLLALRYGHTPVVVANMCPTCSKGHDHVQEIDSYSFQTVGHEVVEFIASCMGLPFRRAYIRAGQSKVQELHYTNERDKEDEIEVLYQLLYSVKEEFPDVEGVTTGAILSHYQRYRVEDVCNRLGLCSLAYLWQRPAHEVLDMAAALHVRAVLVKTASIGLIPRIHLGMSLEDVRPVLEKAQQLYGVHSAGEGGEFETIVLDCPLFRSQCLEIVGMERVIVDDNDYAPSGHARLKVKLREKTNEEKIADENVLRDLPTLTFPSDRMRYLPKADQLSRIRVDPTEPVEVGGPHRQDTTFWGNSCCDVYYSDILQEKELLECCLTSLFQKIVDDMFEQGREVFFMLLFSPCIEYFQTFCRIFVHFFPDVRPPGSTFIELSELKLFRVEVLSAPRCSIDRLTINVRSRSCWGAASTGPHSLSNCVTLSAERRVVVSGCVGMVPVIQRLACKEDLPGLEAVSLSRLSQAIEMRESAVRVFVVQFAFAYANSVVGLTHFGGEGGASAATHATFFLRDMQFAPLLGPLWGWCTGNCTRLVPWNELDTCRVKDQLMCRVIRVTQLPFNADVEIILERRSPLIGPDQ